jgi:two-component system, NarL family, nitrate/nitrite response regulator NarL
MSTTRDVPSVLLPHANPHSSSDGNEIRQGLPAALGSADSKCSILWVLALHRKYEIPAHIHLSGALLEPIAWDFPRVLEGNFRHSHILRFRPLRGFAVRRTDRPLDQLQPGEKFMKAAARDTPESDSEEENDSSRSGNETGPRVEAKRDEIPLRLVVVTGVRLVRDVLSRILGAESGIAFVEPTSVMQAPAAITASRPHIVLADSAIVRGTDLVARAGEAGATVVAFGVAEEDENEVLACAEAGVVGIVERDATLEELVETLKTAVTGNARCSPRVAALVIRRVAKLASLRPADGKGPNLTRREWEIAACIERGLSNKEIASQLGIETATVKNHVHSLLEKLQLRRRGEVSAVLRARGYDTQAFWTPPRS